MQKATIFKIPSLLIVTLILFSFRADKENGSQALVKDIKHGVVYYEEGRFGGWPANHGIWCWGNEILVGFVEARHKTRGGHNYERTTARDKYARSKDGGVTWTIEDAFKNGQTGWRYNNQLSEEKAREPVSLEESIHFTHPDLTLTFLRQTNQTGPSHFYYSYNRGNLWKGPFQVPNLGTKGVATRTDYIIDGPSTLNAFFTVAKSDGEEGRVLMVRTTDGGKSWKKISWVGPEQKKFNIMPSSVRLSPTEILTVIRTRLANNQSLITAYYSINNGKTWKKLEDPVADTGHGGSPPALVKLKDGRLALAYIYRSEYGSRVNLRFSYNKGKDWSDEIVLRCQDGASRDAGYPRMVQRKDGKLIIVYYWNNEKQEGKKHYRYIASTIVDPDRWKEDN